MEKSINQVKQEKEVLYQEIQKLIENFLEVNPNFEPDFYISLRKIESKTADGTNYYIGHEVNVKCALSV